MEQNEKKKTQGRLMGEQKKPNNPTPAASSITENVVITIFVQGAVVHGNRVREGELKL